MLPARKASSRRAAKATRCDRAYRRGRWTACLPDVGGYWSAARCSLPARSRSQAAPCSGPAKAGLSAATCANAATRRSLAAAQGADAADLFRIGKLVNRYWYPEQYLTAAIYFRAFESLGWSEVDAARLMGKRYSSASGSQRNVDARLRATGMRRGTDSPGGGCAA